MSGAADEWLALLVFVGARAFSDEHQLGARVAHSKHNLFAPQLVQLAARAVAQIFANDCERLGRIGGSGLGLGNGGFENVFFRPRRHNRLGIHLFSLFGLDGGGFNYRTTIKIVNTELVVILDALGQDTLELRIQHRRHQAFTARRLRNRTA